MIVHHIGLVVKNIEEHYNRYYYSALGFNEISKIFVDKIIGVKVAFINLNNKIYLELIEPIDNSSPVFNFLQKRGSSLHHLCFEVENIHYECERLREFNYLVTLSPTPAVAFDNRKIAFLMSKEENFLIELLEKNEDSFSYKL